MLSKFHSSKRNVTKGWFLKLNKDPILDMTIVDPTKNTPSTKSL